MNQKSLIWLGLFVGGAIGGYLPTLWGAGFLSFSSLFGNAIGALIGIYIGFKLGNY